jgi:hypothetical protein
MRRHLAVAALVLTISGPSFAEPIIIVGGSFTPSSTPNILGNAPLDLRGLDGSEFQLNWRDPAQSFGWRPCIFPGCLTGTLVSPDARYVLRDGLPFFGMDPLPPRGTAMVNGQSYPPPDDPRFLYVVFDGYLHFAGDSFAVPAVPDGEIATIDVPFVFSGLLNGYDFFRRDTLRLFSVELQGSGVAHFTVRAGLGGDPEHPRFTVRPEYEFIDPVPEPATLGMVAVGAVITLGRRRVWRRVKSA